MNGVTHGRIARAFMWAGVACAALPGVGGVAAGAGQFHQHVHEHGKVTFNVAVEGGTVSIGMDVPAANVIGFEHAPRTDAQRRTVSGTAAWLRSGRDLFAFTPAAGCTFSAADVTAPQWKTGAGHADYEARFTFRCAHPDRLEWLQLRLLSKLRDLHEARVNILTATLQAVRTVKSADARVGLK